MGEEKETAHRLTTYTDAVFAVIVTIMVLELRAPVSGHGKGVACRELSRHPARLHIELRANPPDDFRLLAFRGKHAAQKKQIAGLHRFYIAAE